MLACLWKWAGLSTGTPIGNLEGGSFTGKFERQMKKGSGYGPSLSMEAKGYWREGEGCFTGNSESYMRHIKEGFGNRTSLCL